jgi:outer membrane protein TolC
LVARLIACAVAATVALPSLAADAESGPAGVGSESRDEGLLVMTRDPVLEALIREALDRSPEYASARATVEAERQRPPQVGALPDPTVSLGIQNDGFDAIRIGEMETSFWQIMVTQGFPWPGKRGAREEAARAQARVAEAQLDRIRLSTRAQVERAYVDLLRTRDQLRLQEKLEALWKEAEVMARTRYEVGQGAQSDLLRAQLERTRLQQQRIALEVAERTRIQVLNRLRVHPLDEPIETPSALRDLRAPALVTAEQMVSDSERRSPELAQAKLSVAAADRRVEAAKKERYPDFSVTAGIMPRGSLDPMWLATVGISIPLWSGRKQSKAVEESAYRREAGQQGEESARQVVRLRAQERHSVLAAALRTSELYQGGLLVQSDAAVRSAMAQYQVGKVTFASVLEVLRGLVADESGFLDSLAQVQRVAIAQREVSTDPASAAGGALASGTIPGAGAMAGGGGGGGGGAAAAAPQDQAAPAAGGGMAGGM